MNKNIIIPMLIAFFIAVIFIEIYLNLQQKAYASLILQNHTLPRIGMALLCGGLLSIASLVLQYISQNPLASDSTFGIAPGAGLALFMGIILYPTLATHYKIFIAFLGGIGTMFLLLSLSLKNHFSVLTTTLTGMVLSLFFSSSITTLMLLYPNESFFVSFWLNGDLTQDNPYNLYALSLYALPALIGIVLIAPSLTLLILGENTAKSIGVNVAFSRLIGIILCTYLIALVVSFVGIIAFIGFVCATLAQQSLPPQKFLAKVLLSALMGALLLGVIDTLLQIFLTLHNTNIPTGSITPLVGIPLMLYLALSCIKEFTPSPQDSLSPKKTPPYLFGILCIIFIIACGFSLCISYTQKQWHMSLDITLIEFRLSRMLVALSAGIILASLGVILQRLSQNPMASPELLGINTGVSLGILFALFFAPHLSFWLGVAGACIVMVLIFFINKEISTQKIILTGVAIMALGASLEKAITTLGDIRVYSFLTYTSGSTYWTEFSESLLFFLAALGASIIALSFSKILQVLALGTTGATCVGLNVPFARGVLLLFCALMSTLVCLHIGPISFIGLLAPHIAFSLGLYKAHLQLIGAMMIGAIIMVFSDFLGRHIVFPYEIPAGLIATLLGSLYFIFSMRKF